MPGKLHNCEHKNLQVVVKPTTLTTRPFHIGLVPWPWP